MYNEVEPPYQFWLVDGEFGSGKTLFLTKAAVDLHKSYDYVYANYNLFNIDNFIKLNRITEDVILNLEEDSLLLITEGYRYVDKRFCMNKKNIKITHALQQIRKLDIDIVVDTFEHEWLDFRIIKIANKFIRAKGRIQNSNFFVYVPIEYDKINMTFEEINFKLIQDMTNYFKFYDTKEKIRSKVLLTKWIETKKSHLRL